MRGVIVSLRVSELARSVAFYRAIGFALDERFTEAAAAACLVWSEAVRLMLLTPAQWRAQTDRPLPAPGTLGVMLMLSCGSRAEVDAMAAAAGAHGGGVDINPVQDEGFCYGRDLADPDGHALGALWMDAGAVADAASR